MSVFAPHLVPHYAITAHKAVLKAGDFEACLATLEAKQMRKSEARLAALEATRLATARGCACLTPLRADWQLAARSGRGAGDVCYAPKADVQSLPAHRKKQSFKSSNSREKRQPLLPERLLVTPGEWGHQKA